jgi:hypothetical protein
VTTKRKKWLLVLAGVAVVVTIALAAWLIGHREPTYQGQTLSQWLGTPVVGRSNQSAVDNAIQQMGTNALPCLLEWVSYDPSQHKLKCALRSLLRNLPPSLLPESLRIQRQLDLDEGRAELAADSFAVLGNAATPALPRLTELLNKPTGAQVSRRVARALSGIGPEGFLVLAAHLANTNATNREASALALATPTSLHTTTNTVVPLLIRTLQDHDRRVAAGATIALGRIAQRPDSPRTMILAAVTNCFSRATPPTLRSQEIYIVGHCGPQAEPFIPALLAATAEPELRVRMSATNALERLAPQVLTNAPPP